MGLQIGQGFNERPHVLAESLGVNGTLPSSYRGAGVFLGRVPLHKEECPQKVDQRRRFRHHLVDGEKIPPNQCNGCCTTKEGPKTAVFGSVGGKRLIREAVLDLLGEDVDVLNRWLALAGSLVRCLAEAGTCAWRFVIVVFAGVVVVRRCRPWLEEVVCPRPVGWTMGVSLTSLSLSLVWGGGGWWLCGSGVGTWV